MGEALLAQAAVAFDRALPLLARAASPGPGEPVALPVDAPLSVLALRHAEAPGQPGTGVHWIRALQPANPSTGQIRMMEPSVGALTAATITPGTVDAPQR